MRGDWKLPRPGPHRAARGRADPARGRATCASIVRLRERVAEAIAAACGEPRIELVAAGPLRPRRGDAAREPAPARSTTCAAARAVRGAAPARRRRCAAAWRRPAPTCASSSSAGSRPAPSRCAARRNLLASLADGARARGAWSPPPPATTRSASPSPPQRPGRRDPRHAVRAAHRTAGEAREAAPLPRRGARDRARPTTTRSRAAEAFQRETGATFVHAFEDPRTAAGQGTAGARAARAVPGAGRRGGAGRRRRADRGRRHRREGALARARA